MGAPAMVNLSRFSKALISATVAVARDSTLRFMSAIEDILLVLVACFAPLQPRISHPVGICASARHFEDLKGRCRTAIPLKADDPVVEFSHSHLSFERME